MRTPAVVTLLLAALAPAQERAAKPRPVPDLAPPSALAWPLPCAKWPKLGAGFVIDASRKKPMLRWFTDSLRGEPFPSRDADGPSTAARTIVLGDFDGDGTNDVLVRGTTGVGLLRVDGSDIQVPVAERLRLQRDEWLSGTACDWFGDGAAALACTGDGQIVALRRLTAAGGSQTLLRFDVRDLPSGAAIVGTAGDFDLDGMPDLVIALPERGIVWYRNEGTRQAPRFSNAIPLWPAMPGVIATWIALAPVDDDPWLDLLVGTAGRTHGEPGDFRLREPRMRTEAEDATLRALEAENAPEGDAPRLPDNLVAGGAPDNPFAKLLAIRQRKDRIDALRWREVEMVARPPVVHLRVRR